VALGVRVNTRLLSQLPWEAGRKRGYINSLARDILVVDWENNFLLVLFGKIWVECLLFHLSTVVKEANACRKPLFKNSSF
jgi:hypothetical protein